MLLLLQPLLLLLPPLPLHLHPHRLLLAKLKPKLQVVKSGAT